MRSEKEKMIAGELYNALDEQLAKDRMHARILFKAVNDSREDQPEKEFAC